MASTNIKLFDENKSNMMPDAEYGSNTQRANGVQTGVASSELQNKFQYQMSLVGYAIAQLMMANGKDALDSAEVSTFVGNLSDSVVQKVLDKATDNDMELQTSETKWVSPKNIKGAPKEDKYAVTLPTASWVADEDDWQMSITFSTGTANSQVDLQADKTAIKQMLEDGTSAIYVTNNGGTFTVHAIGEKPSVDLNIQATVIETKQIS